MVTLFLRGKDFHRKNISESFLASKEKRDINIGLSESNALSSMRTESKW